MSNFVTKPHFVLFNFLMMFVIARAEKDIPNTPSEAPTTITELNVSKHQDEENDDDIKLLLEEKYKFRNDETSTRYRITQVKGEQTAKGDGTSK